jgi:hypothetical protein
MKLTIIVLLVVLAAVGSLHGLAAIVPGMFCNAVYPPFEDGRPVDYWANIFLDPTTKDDSLRRAQKALVHIASRPWELPERHSVWCRFLFSGHDTPAVCYLLRGLESDNPILIQQASVAVCNVVVFKKYSSSEPEA